MKSPAEIDAFYDHARATSNWRFGHHIMRTVYRAHGLRVGAELGVAAAGHAHALLSEPSIEKLYGVDSYRHREGYDDVMNLPQKDFDDLYKHVLRFMAPFGDRFRLVRAGTILASLLVPDGLDFVYVDAEHTHKAVTEDLAAWWPKLRVGGIMSGHDWNMPEVRQAVMEFWRTQKASTIFEEAGCNWWFFKETQ